MERALPKRNLALEKIIKYFLITFIAWVVIAMMIIPSTEIVVEAFTKDGEFSSRNFERLYGSKRVVELLGNTVKMAFMTLFTVTIIGLFQVAVVEYFKIRGQFWLKIAFLTPLVYESIAIVSGYQFVYGNVGLVTTMLVKIFPDIDPYWFKGEHAVLILHSFAMTGGYMLFVRSALQNTDFSIVRAAHSLGMGPVATFFKVVIPTLKPTCFAISILLILGALGSYAAPAKLGGRDFQMISVVILSLSGMGRMGMAAMLALVLTIVSMALLLLLRHIQKGGVYYSLSKTKSSNEKIKITNPVINGVIHGIAYILFVIYMLPVVAVVLLSFAPLNDIINGSIPAFNTLTLDHYRAVFATGDGIKPLFNSFLIGGTATLMGLMFALLCVQLMHNAKPLLAGLLEFATYIPWFVPGIAIALGFMIIYGDKQWYMFNQPLLGEFIILPLVLAIGGVPFKVHMLKSAFASLDPNLEKAGQSLGATTFYIFRRITFPLIAPFTLIIGALSFQGTLTEFVITPMLYNINNRTLGVAISDATRVEEPDVIAMGLVYIVLIMILSIIIVGLANYYGLEKEKSDS